MRIEAENGRLIIRNVTSKLIIEAWGPDSFRVRMTPDAGMEDKDWALSEKMPECKVQITYNEFDNRDPWDEKPRIEKEYTIANGKIKAKVTPEGFISFYNYKGELLLGEYWRNRDRINRYAVPLRVDAREFKPICGTDSYKLTMRFEANEGERIYGMGQYQEGRLNKKGEILELCHRNSQASVPFYISSRGYGFLWNNPAIGQVVFGENRTEWVAESTRKLDYFITAGDTPAELEEHYSLATGRTPMMPEYGMGYWQCKLRYKNREELLKVAREHINRGLPMDVIVIDFFHWTLQGDFKFEPRDWPDPEGMIKELEEMGIKTCVSVWPLIDERSENYTEMNEKGYLVTADRGMPFHMTWMGNTVFYDTTNPGARKFVWDKCKENYYDKGVKIFWLDEAEPEYGPYDFDNYRYYAGPALSCSNFYPSEYARGFYEGLMEAGEKEVMSLVRCAWAGSQKYGVLTWSGDVHSDFRSMREQLQAGLSMGIAGIPWWTSDIGGFVGGYKEDPEFMELLIRWFQWSAFCPVFRMHGERQPWEKREQEFIDGVRQLASGAENEVWSFGTDTYEIFRKYILLREELRPYIRECMKEAHETGAPVMRPMFYEFPSEEACAELQDQYMLGSRYLVAPVLYAGCKERTVYLPKGTWVECSNGRKHEGGHTVTVDTPIDVIPVFEKLR